MTTLNLVIFSFPLKYERNVKYNQNVNFQKYVSGTAMILFSGN